LHRHRQIVVVAEVDPVITAPAIDVEVVHDGKQPGPQIAFALPQAQFLQGPLQGLLHQVVGSIRTSRQRARVAAQTGNFGNYGVAAAHLKRSRLGVNPQSAALNGTSVARALAVAKVSEWAAMSCLVFMVLCVGAGVLQHIYERSGQFIPVDALVSPA
jgi:hypothetical protein